MFERNPGPSRQPALQPARQQPTQEVVAPQLTPTSSRSVQEAQLNTPPPDLSPRDPAADPCCGMGHVVRAVATKVTSALGMGGAAAQTDRQARTQAEEERAPEVPADPRRANFAADLAREAAADTNHPHYEPLSAAMCWDSVKHCGVEAGAVSRDVDAKGGLVKDTDPLVPNYKAAKELPAGSVVGFFEGDRLVHAMLSVGEGRACGNKNDCVGFENAKWVGWESHDLKDLKWDGNGGINAPGLHDPQRTLLVRARPLGT